MKNCCKKWKEAELFLKEASYIYTGGLYVGPHSFKFCQDCGSSLKEEEHCDCTRPIRGLVETDYCMNCHRYIEKSTPTPKLPKGFSVWQKEDGGWPVDYHARYQINQLIDYLKDFEELREEIKDLERKEP